MVTYNIYILWFYLVVAADYTNNKEKTIALATY